VSVALVFQQAKRMCLITVSFVACPVYYSYLQYLINGTIFGKSDEYKMCVLIFSETFLILKTMQRGMYVNTSSCKVTVILVKFSSNLAFLGRFSENLQMSNFVKIRPMEAKLFHVGEQTDEHTNRRDEANCLFSQETISCEKCRHTVDWDFRLQNGS